MKFLHFAMTAIMGLPETAEGLKECEDSMQALNDLRFKVILYHCITSYVSRASTDEDGPRSHENEYGRCLGPGFSGANENQLKIVSD